MPTGPEHLHRQWEDDGKAVAALRSIGWRWHRVLPGYLSYPVGRTKETPVETSAMDYLFLEWDHGFDPDIVLLLPGR